MYLRLKIPYTQHEFIALNIYSSSYSKKSDAKIYIVLLFQHLNFKHS